MTYTRYRNTLVSALLPPLAERDLSAFWQKLDASAPPALKLGLRASVLALSLSPTLLLGRPRTVLGLSGAEREQLLSSAAASRLWPLRQMVTTLKMVACWALFSDATARAPYAPNDRVAP